MEDSYGTIGGVRQYCGVGCYGEAKKKGRLVRLTTMSEYPMCWLCEQRTREGLVHYSPSNGTEFDIFQSHCYRCRHWIDDTDNPQPTKLEAPFVTCKWGVLDRVMYQMCTEADHISHWFDPEDLSTKDATGRPICPARCLRFRDKNDASGDPPPRDMPGQMTFSDVLVVKEPAARVTVMK
jgi:hypothetical protein